MLNWRRCGLALAVVPYGVLLAQQSGTQKVPSYSREVAPILKAHCTSCHSGTNADGGLDLLTQKGILRGGDSGPALLAGKPTGSLILQRILGVGGLPKMPKGQPPLSQEEVRVLTAWIAGGAKFDKAKVHWAYVPPVAPQIPPIKSNWIRNPIDSFVLAKMTKVGLRPSPEASRETLIRRLSLDLIGLPPTISEVDRFLADRRPDAYERLVDSLLASPHYGERQARGWLDLARYADTDGFEKDLTRTAWRYRDWVIEAYNKNLSYRDFVIQQIAGDMLPNATLDEKIATGFNRNTMFNREGGVDQEEAHFGVILDRVDTTATVFLGSTLQCARCHDHKYDPFTQRDYYKMAAFFSNTKVIPKGPKSIGEEKWFEPEIPAPTAAQAQELQRIDAQIKVLESQGSADLGANKGLVSSSEPTAAPSAEEQGKERQSSKKSDPSDLSGPTNTKKTKVGRTPSEAEEELKKLKDKKADLERRFPTAMVLEELPSSQNPFAYVRRRGEFLSKTERVEAGTPAVLPQLPAGRADRLALGQWLASRSNPLTARVEVNRIWEQYFGRGLVETSEDFGTRGGVPTHPELLDWLAVKFMNGGWDMKAIHRLIVTSSTYRQSSDATPIGIAQDPQNLMLARGPRFRLEAELIHDEALAAAGLLSPKIGGPSVMPYQPDKVWDSPYSGEEWTPSQGEDRYRRGIYTFLKRTAPYPAFLTLDSTSRESCTVRRIRTNTPLQALALLNDRLMLDAAKSLGERMLEHKAPDAQRLALGFRICTSRKPTVPEQARLRGLLSKLEFRYERDRVGAKALGGSSEQAAYTMVANVLLNLDETLTKS